MLLVFIFCIVIILIILILSLKVSIVIRLANNKHKIILYLYAFGKICVYKSNLKRLQKKINKANSRMKEKFDITKSKGLIIKIIKDTKFNLEEFKLKTNLSTGDPALTSYSVGIISSSIAILIKIARLKINWNEFRYKIMPIYSNKKILNIKLKCIISTNLVHIIVIIFRSIKDWRRENNGRKSPNRKAYGNCHE